KELLRLMGRKGDRDSFTALITRIRKVVPDIALRTTFMVGFPSDSEDKFRLLCDFCREMEFDHLGVFTYCREKGTSAYRYGDPIPQKVKEDFKRRLMELQASISLKKNKAMVGNVREVMIEGEREGDSYPYWGRLSIQAPEVDGVVFISEGESHPGEFVPVRIEEGYPYDLVGRICSLE
ncbi:MAG: TRAM domain-containing protein, partial [Candidatus Aminicenantes bacterium]|nr:TRAM domain-containing protein [Candidatus Aminicenantes bacterium]